MAGSVLSDSPSFLMNAIVEGAYTAIQAGNDVVQNFMTTQLRHFLFLLRFTFKLSRASVSKI